MRKSAGPGSGESVRVLTVGTAHELNNILTGILGYSELLAAREPAASFAGTAGRGIERAALRASELVSRLAVVAAGGSEHREAVDLHALLRDVAGHVDRAFGPPLRVVAHLRAPRGTVTGETGRLVQLALALAVHARESMGGAGTLTITTRGARATLKGTDGRRRSGEVLVLSITGAGRKGAAPRARSADGAGLLLATVRDIAQRHGGDARLIKAGCEVRLPVVAAPAPRAVATTAPVRAGISAGVLLVDDEELVLTVTGASLRALGYRVETANGGAEAIKRYRARQKSIDLVILDLVMPDRDGLEVLAALRAINPKVRVIMSSAVRDQRADAPAMSSTHGYLRKPYRAAELATCVSKALRAAAR
jgi:CheY-like chemotaxis protein